MNTSPFQEWLESLVSTDENRPNLMVVNRCPESGIVFASDGHVLGSVEDTSSVDAPGDFVFASRLRSVLLEPEGAPVSFEVGALREWAGPIISECGDCDGKPPRECHHCVDGMVECECDCGQAVEHRCTKCAGRGSEPRCKTCGGGGVISSLSRDRIGTFGEGYFNRRILARLLSGLPDGSVAVYLHPAFKPQQIVFVGEAWRGILMLLRADAPLDPAYDHAEEMSAVAEVSTSA